VIDRQDKEVQPFRDDTFFIVVDLAGVYCRCNNEKCLPVWQLAAGGFSSSLQHSASLLRNLLGVSVLANQKCTFFGSMRG